MKQNSAGDVGGKQVQAEKTGRNVGWRPVIAGPCFAVALLGVLHYTPSQYPTAALAWCQDDSGIHRTYS
ncbi:MAG: hypothetical protein RL215_1514 [Planctomycetota bacterium]